MQGGRGMEHTVDNEVAYRLSQGWRQVSFEQFKAEYAAIGYTFEAETPEPFNLVNELLLEEPDPRVT